MYRTGGLPKASATWIGLLIGLSACVDTTVPGANLTAIDGPYDPHDGSAVRLHDLVLADDVDSSLLQWLDLPIVAGPFVDELGRRIVTIRSDGRFAAELARYGLDARGHRTWLRVTGGDALEVAAMPALENECETGPAYPIESDLFAWYDADDRAPRGGVASEIKAMAGPHVLLRSLATTFGNREVLAVRVGPTAPDAEANHVPTVYVVGTHHGHEWIGEEITLRLLRRAVASVKGETGGDSGLAHLT